MWKLRTFYPFIMSLHKVDTLIIKLPKKCYRVDFISPFCKNTFDFCNMCPRCQMIGRILKRNMMPLNPILKVELFDVWNIDFMGRFSSSFGHQYILVAVDYVSNWVKTIPCKTNDNKVVIKFLKENIFSCFETPHAIISDNDTHLSSYAKICHHTQVV